MRESRLFIILISLVMGLVGCSKETMIGEYVDRCAVRLDIDWGPCGIDPDGMTVLFYPVDGGEPSRFLTNMVTGDEVRLRKGIYNVVVFNQAAEEYSYLTIEGQDQYSTLRIVMKTTESDWYTPTEGERLIYDPEPLAVATLEGFEVTQEMVRANLKEGKEFSLACRPEKVIFTTHLSLEIKGLHNVRTARGSIKGMADTYWIANSKTGSSIATQLVDFSEKTFHKNSTTDGILSGSYLTLGRPNVTSKATDEISNLLTLSILLVDNKTVITKQYDIAPRAAINNETKEVKVVLGTGADPDEEETPEDIPLELRMALGMTKSQRINHMVLDVIENSTDKIRMSSDTYELFCDLHDFLFTAVYTNPVCKGEERKAVDMLTKIYGYYIDHVEEMPEEYVRIAGEDGDERAVCDYIAGMSDTYALKVFNHLFVPMFWHE